MNTLRMEEGELHKVGVMHFVRATDLLRIIYSGGPIC